MGSIVVFYIGLKSYLAPGAPVYMRDPGFAHGVVQMGAMLVDHWHVFVGKIGSQSII